MLQRNRPPLTLADRLLSEFIRLSLSLISLDLSICSRYKGSRIRSLRPTLGLLGLVAAGLGGVVFGGLVRFVGRPLPRLSGRVFISITSLVGFGETA